MEAVVTLAERASVFSGYMPYGWLGPPGNGLSDRASVANDAVELTDARCCNAVFACELAPLVWFVS